MVSKPLAIAVLEDQAPCKKGLFQSLARKNQYPVYPAGNTPSLTVGTCSFMGQEHLLIGLDSSALAAHSHSAQKDEDWPSRLTACTDVTVITCDGLHLEQGLNLLAHLIRQSPVKEKGIPLILCVSLCIKAQIMGLLIDFDLLEDVLQIPVLPFNSHRPTGLDDIKAAIAYAGKRHFSYDCLDFSPKKLAAETCRYHKTPWSLSEKLIRHAFTRPFLNAGLAIFTFLFLFWSVLAGAALISGPIQQSLLWLELKLTAALTLFHHHLCPSLLCLDGMVYSVLNAIVWVISIMLPPLVFFIPLCILLEDTGLLPRIAFYTDPIFEKCGGCGKQCLAMAMSFGCHQKGVMECGNIQSPREQLISLLTLCLTPCCGRIYTLLTLLALTFTIGSSADSMDRLWTFPSFFSAACLTAALFISTFLSMAVTCPLSRTLLKKKTSVFTLELPPCRRPRLRQVILPRALDEICLILGKTAAMAVPAGLALWFLANISVKKISLLVWLSRFLDPPGRLLGIDGTVLMAFILSFPANELFLPVMIMTYQAQSTLAFPHLTDAGLLLAANGWQWQTALSVIIFTLFHWPCASVLSAIRKETGSLKWTAAAIAIPTLFGLGIRLLITGLSVLFFSRLV